MFCIRCGKESNDDNAYMNALRYGPNYYACPHCGKLYKFTIEVVTSPCSDEEAKGEVFDDWGNEIVLDRDFNDYPDKIVLNKVVEHS